MIGNGFGETSNYLNQNKESNIGLIPRSLEYIFEQIKCLKQENSEISYKLNAQFIEIYNENIIDLMDDTIDQHVWDGHFRNGERNDNRSLSNSAKKELSSSYISNFAPQKIKPSLREDIRKQIYVEGAQSIELNCLEDCINMLKTGSSRRHISANYINYESSRSHTVFM